jgi:hypothetical protein
MSDAPERRDALDDEGCETALHTKRHRLMSREVSLDVGFRHRECARDRVARDAMRCEELAEEENGTRLFDSLVITAGEILHAARCETSNDNASS